MLAVFNTTSCWFVVECEFAGVGVGGGVAILVGQVESVGLLCGAEEPTQPYHINQRFDRPTDNACTHMTWGSDGGATLDMQAYH